MFTVSFFSSLSLSLPPPHQITKLKIDSNPFAKGFRDSSRLTDLERETVEGLITTPDGRHIPVMGAPFFFNPADQHAAAMLREKAALFGLLPPPTGPHLPPPPHPYPMSHPHASMQSIPGKHQSLLYPLIPTWTTRAPFFSPLFCLIFSFFTLAFFLPIPSYTQLFIDSWSN